MASIYQKRIEEHDPVFYEAILLHIDNMPDLRPLDTVRRMKHVKIDGSLCMEPSNKWRILCEELEAISANGEHFSILEELNEGIIHIDDRETLGELFSFYPGLMWLLVKILPFDVSCPLCFSQGIYLEEMVKEGEWIKHIGSIRSLKTAKTLKEKVPKGSVDINQILNTPLEKDNEKNFVGWAYWALAEGVKINNKQLGNIVNSLSKEADFNLFKLLKPFFLQENSFSWLDIISSNFFEAALEEMVNHLSLDNFYCSLDDSIYFQSISLTKFFLDHINESFEPAGIKDTLELCLRRPHEAIISMVFSHPIFKDYITQISSECIEDIVKQGREDIISLLIQYPFDDKIWEKCLDASIKYRRSSITHIILQNKRMSIYRSHIQDCLTYLNLDSFKILLDVPNRSETEEDEYVFVDTLYAGRKDFVKCLLEHSNVDKSKIPIRYMKEAKNLLEGE